jgi:ABC-2 type transport system permease protein
MSLAHPVQDGMWASVVKLLRLQVILQINKFRRARLGSKILTIFLLLILLAVLVGAFILSWYVLSFLHSPKFIEIVGDAGPFLRGIPTLVFTSAAAIILLSSFGVLLQALYLSGDMDFLLATPLPVRSVFLAKLLQAVLPNFGLICLFALPLLWGLGAAGQYHFLYYPLAVVLLAALALAAASLSSLLVMVVARTFPARRVAEVIGFVVAISSFLCSQSGNLFRGSDVTPDQLQAGIQGLTRLNSLWSPLAWIGQGLVLFGEGKIFAGSGLLLLALVLMGGVFYGTLITAERLYYSGWARMQAGGRRKKTSSGRQEKNHAQRRQRASGVGLFVNRIPASIRAIMVKDFRMLRRDLRNLSQLVTPLILGLVYTVMLLRSRTAPVGQDEAPSWVTSLLQTGFNYGDVLIALFIVWMFAQRLGLMGFSQEGRNYWMIKAAPVSNGRLLTAKFLVAYLPTLAIGWMYLVIFALLQPAKLATLPYGMLILAFSIAGFTGINLAYGILGATFDWKNPQKMVKGGAGCMSAVISFAYTAFALIFFMGPSLIGGLIGFSPLLGRVIGLALGSIFCVACAFIAMRLTASRIPGLDET